MIFHRYVSLPEGTCAYYGHVPSTARPGKPLPWHLRRLAPSGHLWDAAARRLRSAGGGREGCAKPGGMMVDFSWKSSWKICGVVKPMVKPIYMIYGDLGGSLLLCCFTPIHGILNGYLLTMDEQPIVNQAEGVPATLVPT